MQMRARRALDRLFGEAGASETCELLSSTCVRQVMLSLHPRYLDHRPFGDIPQHPRGVGTSGVPSRDERNDSGRRQGHEDRAGRMRRERGRGAPSEGRGEEVSLRKWTDRQSEL